MKILSLLIIFFTFLLLTNNVYALDCSGADKDRVECRFGTITPPSPIAGFIGGDQTGTAGISKFLSNGVALIYSIAVVILVFMLLWGSFEWIISEGDKEKIAAAQKRILNAIIGIILFAVAFAVIKLLGQFTGFEFFVGQNPPSLLPYERTI
ncbi:MAG: pilin [Candidatus Daviesbacteria bacterium]|nr:pilin [Candidatus Daviesbacteria bacterium]